MQTQQETVQKAVHHAREWVSVSRVRVFGTGAGVSVFAMLVSVILPRGLLSVSLAGMFAILAIVLGMVTGATWWADHNGRTDSGDLWDTAPADTADVDDLFTGFSGFTEDGSAPDGRSEFRRSVQ